LGSYRIFFGLSFSCACSIAGCGNLIGFSDYSVADDSVGGSGGGFAGSHAEGGGAGETLGDGGTSGAVDGSSGAAGASGSAESGSAGSNDSGGSSGSGAASGSGGSAGGPVACPGGCDDANDCTSDSCVSAACAHEPLAVGSACGSGRSCDAQAVCVRCRDTAPGAAQDVGCSPTAPVCVGTGLDAACAGCTMAADCNDGNECTSEACTSGNCVFTPVAAGSACATGVCNGLANAEKCVACTNSAAGGAQDAGCTAAKPVCDPSGTPTCYACLTSADCAADSVNCTVATCTNHVCSQVPTDSVCPLSGDVCNPNRCDAVAGCKPVDISTQVTLIDATTVGNGSFETGTQPATGWREDGDYWLTKDCVTVNGCNPGSNSGKTFASAGRVLAWLGGANDSGIGDLNQPLSLPAGAKRLRILADANFQTQSKNTSNKDYFQVRLMDAAYVQIGSPLLAKSNVDAQTGPTYLWTANGVDVTADVSAHAGKVVSVSFWASCDTQSMTDFYLDNVRVTATICK
jgi:hypothetical protein